MRAVRVFACRSMGSSDLYPFVIAAPVQAKLGLVHRLVAGASGS
jgi:hypothetical protein